MATTAEPAAEWVRVVDLVRYEGNPRVNAEAVEKVAASIKAFGFGSPIVAQRSSMVVIAGDTRLKAAKLLGLETVPVRLVDVTDEVARALRVADNRTGAISDWDYAALSRELREIGEWRQEDVALLGFTAGELEALLVGATPPQRGEGRDPEPDGAGYQPGAAIELTAQQRAVFDEAAATVRGRLGAADMSDGRCLELICADFTQDPNWNTPEEQGT